MKTYTCPEYSCKILVEIAFDLQKNNKFVAQKFIILTAPSECSYVYVYLIQIFLESHKYVFKNQELVLMCQHTFRSC
jgi:hypothetical protein